MQCLIHLALLLIARLGLFLSVVAWVVGQWWSCTFLIRGVRVELISYGLILSHRPPLDAWDLVVATCEGSWKFSAGRSDDEWLFNDWLFGYDVKLVPAYSPFVNHEIPSRWGVPGLTRANAHGTRIIAFSYWLVVTIFATFYTVLKYVYRKRPESPPCKN